MPSATLDTADPVLSSESSSLPTEAHQCSDDRGNKLPMPYFGPADTATTRTPSAGSAAVALWDLTVVLRLINPERREMTCYATGVTTNRRCLWDPSASAEEIFALGRRLTTCHLNSPELDGLLLELARAMLCTKAHSSKPNSRGHQKYAVQVVMEWKDYINDEAQRMRSATEALADRSTVTNTSAARVATPDDSTPDTIYTQSIARLEGKVRQLWLLNQSLTHALNNAECDSKAAQERTTYAEERAKASMAEAKATYGALGRNRAHILKEEQAQLARSQILWAAQDGLNKDRAVVEAERIELRNERGDLEQKQADVQRQQSELEEEHAALHNQRDTLVSDRSALDKERRELKLYTELIQSWMQDARRTYRFSFSRKKKDSMLPIAELESLLKRLPADDNSNTSKARRIDGVPELPARESAGLAPGAGPRDG